MSLSVASCISHIFMHVGIYVATSMVFMLLCKPVISFSLFSACICLDSKAVIYRSSPCL